MQYLDMASDSSVPQVADDAATAVLRRKARYVLLLPQEIQVIVIS